MITLFKNKKVKKQEVDTKIENIKMIAVPDIREYMIQGYKEIEQVKQDKEAMERSRNNYKQDAEKFEKLYDATLVTLNEFKQRDERNTKKITELENKLEAEMEFSKQDNKIQKDEINKLQEEIIVLNNKNGKLKNTTKEIIKNQLTEKIKKTKGNLSKNKIIEIIKTI